MGFEPAVCFVLLWISATEGWRMRLRVLWFAFCLLFSLWLAGLFFHLRGGLITYSLVMISLLLLIKTASTKKAS